MSLEILRVAIVSEHEVVVTGIAGLLGHHPDRVQVVDLEAAPGAPDPDVILYDVFGLQGGDGHDLQRLVVGTSAAVLAVARELRPDLASRAMALGADGYVALGAEGKELLAAVESARIGSPTEVVGSSQSDAVALRLGHEVGLTGREVDVLRMITQGYSNQQIAERSYLSINSVKTYIRSAYRRIGVTSRSQAVVWALQHGFTTETDHARR